METALPVIPAKRYFTIGEVGDLCGVKPHVLRYWEQEFSQLRPMKRRGNRRYYQHHEVLMIRRIRELLYEQGFTISGARNKLQEQQALERERSEESADASHLVTPDGFSHVLTAHESATCNQLTLQTIRTELMELRLLLDEVERIPKKTL